MKHDIVPCVWIGDLEQALELQYGSEFIEEIKNEYNSLRDFMFDFYMNDLCCKYYISDDVVNDLCQTNEYCIKTFLRDTFPGYDYIIVDVFW